MLQTPFALTEADYDNLVRRLCARKRWSLAYFKTLDYPERQYWLNAEQELDALLDIFEEKVRESNDGNLEPAVALQITLTRYGYA